MITSTLAGPVATSLPQRLRRVLAPLLRALSHRLEVRRLAYLDDRMLKDIGLTRAEVEGALSAPLLDDPSTLLVRSVERRRRGRPVVASVPSPRL